MQRVFIILALPWLVMGCATSSNDPAGARARAVRCAESWKARGFDFDPNAMTCAEMYQRAQAIRNAAYWRKRGYRFDPNTMTAKEMDTQAAELKKAGISEYRDPALNLSAGTEPPPRAPAAPPVASAPAPAGAGVVTAAPTPEPTAKADATGPELIETEPETEPAEPVSEDDLRQMLADMTIKEVRKKYPQYSDMDDLELARRIHATYFSDVPFEEYARRFFQGQR